MSLDVIKKSIKSVLNNKKTWKIAKSTLLSILLSIFLVLIFNAPLWVGIALVVTRFVLSLFGWYESK